MPESLKNKRLERSRCFLGTGGNLLVGTPSFDLEDNYKFCYNTTGLFMNGNIISDGKLFWTSNTWHTANKDAESGLEQWWYLAGNLPLTKNSSIWPHIGLVHSWKFDRTLTSLPVLLRL